MQDGIEVTTPGRVDGDFGGYALIQPEVGSTVIFRQGDKLAAARRLVDHRNRMGRRYTYRPGRGGRLTADSLIRAFCQEADRQQLLVKKAALTQNRLLFIVSALRTLLADEHFVTVLRAEGLDSMPRSLADRVEAVALHAS